MVSWNDLPIEIDPGFAERYTIREQIGKGGYATVFRGTQVATGQDVAIKVLRVDRRAWALEPEEQIERFRREMRLCGELHHPNIVPILDWSETADGGFCAVFAFVPGWNLGDIISAEGSLEPEEAVHLMTQVIDAVSSAHARGIIHRDLKPDNIMINPTGVRRNALVLDFGLGTIAGDPLRRDFQRLTQLGEYLGTPVYSAPEQLRGEEPTVRSDLYSWGLILLECLTGHPAMGGRTTPETIHRHLGPEPVPIPAALAGHPLSDLLRRVTEKDVERRDISPQEVLGAMQRCARGPLPARDELAARRDETDEATRRTTQRRSRAELSPIFLVPLARNPNFTGREELLSAIAESLDSNPLLAVAALDGMEGVGKTQIALEYAYRNADRYRMVAWIRAEEPETLVADYCAMGAPLGLPETPDQREGVAAVRSWLERNDGWLLVLDNATDLAALRAFLPRSHAGHVLITSRHTSWRELAASFWVDVLDPRNAAEFLLARTGETNASAAEDLSEELGRLPLALEEAAAYMEATGRSIDSFLPHLRRHRSRLLFGEPAIPAQSGMLRTTWQLSFERIEEEAPRASDLLKLCGFLAPDDIPLDLFRAGSKRLPPELKETVRDELAFDAALVVLRRYSLVKIEGDRLAIHRLVQLAAHDRLSEAEIAEWTANSLRMVEAAYPVSALAGAYEPASERFLPHAVSVLNHARPYEACNEVSARLLRRTGIYRSARCMYDQASYELERALSLFEKAPKPNEEQIAAVLWERAMVLYVIGQPDIALELLQRVVGMVEQQHGERSIRLAAQLVTLSWVLRTLGDFDASLEVARRSLEIAEKRAARDDVIAAMSLANIARGLWYGNRVREAREAADRCFSALMEGDLHPVATGTIYNVGQVLLELGDPRRALRCAERALEISERAYGAHHPLVSLNYGVQGAALLRLGEPERARRSLEVAIAGGERTCRDLHEDFSMARSELGTLLWNVGERKAALETLAHAVASEDRVCGDPSRSRIHARLALARVLCESGDADAARRECDIGLATARQRYGPDHPVLLSGLGILARVLRSLGAADEARRQLNHALRVAESSDLGDHPSRAEILEQLGELCAERSDATAARDHLSLARAMFERCLGEEHEACRRVRNRLDGLAPA